MAIDGMGKDEQSLDDGMHCGVVDCECGSAPLERVDSVDASNSLSSCVFSPLAVINDC